MYKRPRANVKVKRGSTFTFTRDLPYIASVLFIGLISAALWVLHEREERGLISRTAAGYRAYILKQQQATAFLSDGRQPEVDLLNHSAVVWFKPI